MNDQIIERALLSIDLFCHEFRDNPYDYLLESDIQCALLSRMREGINKHVEVVGINRESYSLNVVNSEYLDHFDICCLNPEEISVIAKSDVKQNKGHDDYIYQLPTLLALELKYIWAKQRKSFDIFTSDVSKIHNSKFNDRLTNWMTICFIQHQDSADWQIKYSDSNYKIAEVNKIADLNASYIVAPESTYTVTRNVTSGC